MSIIYYMAPEPSGKAKVCNTSITSSNLVGASFNYYSSLAQSVEHAAVNRSVVGSSPTGGAFLIKLFKSLLRN